MEKEELLQVVRPELHIIVGNYPGYNDIFE